MNDALHFILSHIVEHPDNLVIDTQDETEERVVFVVHVHQEDMGRIIGKQGRIIRAIRDLVKLMAAKRNMYADVQLSEQ